MSGGAFEIKLSLNDPSEDAPIVRINSFSFFLRQIRFSYADLDGTTH